ncbi:hypothetical protein L9F63_027586, partial [Diploptera punctata]
GVSETDNPPLTVVVTVFFFIGDSMLQTDGLNIFLPNPYLKYISNKFLNILFS